MESYHASSDGISMQSWHLSSLSNQAFAVAQSRMTVTGDMPSASEVSSTLMPPKYRISTI